MASLTRVAMGENPAADSVVCAPARRRAAAAHIATNATTAPDLRVTRFNIY
jgi:hypothetical protein